MNNTALQYVQNTNVELYSKNPEGLLKWIVKNLPNDKVVMGTGFGPPGIVLLDMLFKVTRNISVFYIDTSFLFEQTYDLKNKLEKKYLQIYQKVLTMELELDYQVKEKRV